MNVSADRTRGHIVICDDAWVKVDAQARIIKNLYDNGAAQVVLIGREKSGFSLSFREYGSSVVEEPAAVGRKLKDYTQYPDSAAQAFFKGTQLGVRQSPTVAYFSSRGPSRSNPHIVKPDILAPGLNILAAATASPDRGPFRFKSGTSMAAPHISGVVALLKSVHPNWSPAAIRSAIMTTADDLDNDGNRIMDERREPASAFAAGAGHVNATRAVDPGLVYDLEVRDYAGYVCHLFAKARRRRRRLRRARHHPGLGLELQDRAPFVGRRPQLPEHRGAGVHHGAADADERGAGRGVHRQVVHGP